jgi:hypothetical protein
LYLLTVRQHGTGAAEHGTATRGTALLLLLKRNLFQDAAATHATYTRKQENKRTREQENKRTRKQENKRTRHEYTTFHTAAR